MTREWTAAALAAAALGAAACARGPSAAPARAVASDTVPWARHAPPPPVDVAEIDSLIRKTVTQKRLVGLSVGVAQDGRVVLARGYGMASLAAREPVTPETEFAVGSVTKQFTCAALFLLAQDGKLHLTDSVSTYLPTLTRGDDITLLDLGQHVSGYRDFYPLDFVDREMLKPTTADDVIREYATRPLDFQPGTRWSYSNTNFLILGRVIEKASGESYGSFLAARLLGPLKLQHTSFEPAAGRSGPALATGYTSFALGAPTPATPEARGWTGAAGGIWSTPADLITWDLALADGKVISPASYRLMTTPRRLTDGTSTGYGCGEFVDTRGRALVVSHGGAVSGFVTSNTVIPSTRSAVVLMANEDFASLGDLSNAIVAKLLPRAGLPAVQGPPALEAARELLASLRLGRPDRTTLGDEFNAYLTPARVAEAQARLWAGVSNLVLENRVERGGMEVAALRFLVGTVPAQALLYRTPDGKIQEFLMYRQ